MKILLLILVYRFGAEDSPIVQTLEFDTKSHCEIVGRTLEEMVGDTFRAAWRCVELPV